MKPFEEMTKAEKIKVLEEDYLERQKQEEIKLQRKEQRAKRLKRHAYTWFAMLHTLMFLTAFIAFVVCSVTEGGGEAIAGAVFFGLMSFGWLYLIIYYSIGD